MSDRLAVFNHGRVEQIGSPSEIYDRPASQFVAGFVGQTNLLEGYIAQRLGGFPATYAVRPERIRILPPEADVPMGMASIEGRVDAVTYLGATLRVEVEVDGGRLMVIEQNLEGGTAAADRQPGAAVKLVIERKHIQAVAESS